MRTGLAEKTVSQIINGLAPITLDTADKFELALGIPSRLWNKRELSYREALARVEASHRLEGEAKWLKEIPVKELIDRRYIDASNSRGALVRQVLRFFGVSNVEAWRATWTAPAAQYRGANVQARHPGKVATWLRMGEVEAEKLKCEPYDPEKFRSALRQIREYADKPASEWYPAMIRLCAAAGVAVVFVKEIPGASVSGATKWLGKDKAVIMLTLKYKTDDHVWFTFFHEAAHVLLHGKKLVFIEDDSETNDSLEREADRLSRNVLIPTSRIGELALLKGRLGIQTFARSIRVSPGIVVGRLQKDGLMSHKFCNNLKVKLQWPQPNEGQQE
jgi:Zn-dependent peptidase ImmA (M78 family)/transcriptional regulator with XRE-family HTH domain